MTVAALRETVTSLGGELYLSDGQLHLRLPRDARAPAGLRANLRAHRAELVTELGQTAERARPYAVLVGTPYLDHPLWVASDERALAAPDVARSGYPAVLAVEILRLGHPADILELLAAKRVFGPGTTPADANVQVPRRSERGG